MSSKENNQSAKSVNTGPNIVYTGTKHTLRKDGTSMDNPPATPKVAAAAHNHGRPNNG